MEKTNFRKVSDISDALNLPASRRDPDSKGDGAKKAIRPKAVRRGCTHHVPFITDEGKSSPAKHNEQVFNALLPDLEATPAKMRNVPSRTIEIFLSSNVSEGETTLDK